MKLANITSKIIKTLYKLHRWALVADCSVCEVHSERAFKRASYQLELVRVAKKRLDEAQHQALEAQATAQKAWAVAAEEIKVGI